MHAPSSPNDHRNLLIAVIISVAIMLVWQFAYENPHRVAEQKHQQELQSQQRNSVQVPVNAVGQPVDASAPATLPEREALLSEGGRVRVDSENLHGSIALKGARLDDLTLARYRTTTEKDSPEVVLLSPSGNEHAYFAELGWLSPDKSVAVPDAETLWQTSATKLTPDAPVTLRWNNGQGQTFEITYAMDAHFMFTVRQNVVNAGTTKITLVPYGYVNRAYPTVKDKYAILHEGPLGVLSGALQEIHYKALREEGKQTFQTAEGWLGITDKYWLTALVPSKENSFTGNFSHYVAKGLERYQVEYVGQTTEIPAGASAGTQTRVFAGAKEVGLLDSYSDQFGIPLFDRAVDFGHLYFLTKPIFKMLNYFYEHIGNFGLAILLLTVIIRGAMFPIANKSYASMAQMRALQPKMQAIRDRNKDDKLKMNQEVMELYKKEKINPMSGCLPMLIQLPVFFALYKTLFVTIEMRHAPFYGWIHDLSAPDPTNIFTLFGLIPWVPPAMLHVGVLPMLMSLTMYIQQQFSPAPNDPVQAKIMKMLPLVFLFLFGSFPAGLVLYWTWSNLLSILQQWVITKKHGKPAAAAAVVK